MESLKRFGESKKEAKDDYNKNRKAGERPNITEGIYSKVTYENYTQYSKELIDFIKVNYPDIKKIENITRDIVKDYLRDKATDYESSWSMATACSAMNKIFETHTDYDRIYKGELGFGKRETDDIFRSRGHEERLKDPAYQKLLDENKEQTIIAQATGCRRRSIYGGDYQVKPNSFFYDMNRDLRCSLIEKGGRYREAKVLDVYKEQVIKIVERTGYHIEERESLIKNDFKEIYDKSEEDVLFDRYNVHIDNHSFRAEYADNRYQEIISTCDEVENNYRGYNREALEVLTQDLGHGRIDICIDHYLGRQ